MIFFGKEDFTMKALQLLIFILVTKCLGVLWFSKGLTL